MITDRGLFVNQDDFNHDRHGTAFFVRIINKKNLKFVCLQFVYDTPVDNGFTGW